MDKQGANIGKNLPSKENMSLKVQIVSREIIKPSSPTPNHLKTHKLSILDQLSGSRYIPIILFYSAAGQNSSQTSNHLKKSLSETLTHFYPLAGRVKNRSYIDCNDDGSTYIEAHVDSDMSIVLNRPNMEQLLQLLPCYPNDNSANIEEQELLAVQVNYFRCGRMVISVCVHHVTADGFAAANFVKSWAAIATGANGISGVVHDCTSLFPPLDLSNFSWGNYQIKDHALEHVMKRFVFEGSKIVALREKIGNGPYLKRPTRYEAVSALIWGALIHAIRERDKNVKEHAAATIVSLRKKMSPPLPEQCLGNICDATAARCSMENETDYNELAGKIRESIRKMSNEYVRKLHEDNYLNYLKSGAEQLLRSEVRMFIFSCMCRFPFYETDFGRGKPIWVAVPFWQNMGAIFLDTRDGEGIEAWVGLPKEDMARLEQNPDILEYAVSTIGASCKEVD